MSHSTRMDDNEVEELVRRTLRTVAESSPATDETKSAPRHVGARRRRRALPLAIAAAAIALVIVTSVVATRERATSVSTRPSSPSATSLPGWRPVPVWLPAGLALSTVDDEADRVVLTYVNASLPSVRLTIEGQQHYSDLTKLPAPLGISGPTDPPGTVTSVRNRPAIVTQHDASVELTFFQRPTLLITLSSIGLSADQVAKVARYLVYLDDVGWSRVRQPSTKLFRPTGVPEETAAEGPIGNGESWLVVRDVFGTLDAGLEQCSGVFIVHADGTYGPDYVPGTQACPGAARGEATVSSLPFDRLGPVVMVDDMTVMYGRVSPSVAVAHVIVDGVAVQDATLASSTDDLTPTQYLFAFVPTSATSVDIELVAADGHTMYRGTFDPKEAGG